MKAASAVVNGLLQAQDTARRLQECEMLLSESRSNVVVEMRTAGSLRKEFEKLASEEQQAFVAADLRNRAQLNAAAGRCQEVEQEAANIHNGQKTTFVAFAKK